MLTFFYAGLFTSFRYLNTTTQALSLVKNQNIFLLATLDPSIIDFK